MKTVKKVEENTTKFLIVFSLSVILTPSIILCIYMLLFNIICA